MADTSESLKNISIDSDSLKNIVLIEDTIFESNENVFIDGYIGELAIDQEERVFITGTKPGSVGIYVFEPNGNFITKFTNEGRGPGEYEAIGSMDIRNDTLFVLGSRLQKIGLFSTKDFSHMSDLLIRKDLINTQDTLTKMLRVNMIRTPEQGGIYVRLANLSLSKKNEIAKSIFHRLSPEGQILEERILTFEKFRFYFPKNQGYPILMPFSRNTITAIAKNGIFYSAWSEDFLIKVYDQNGNFKRSLYHPFSKADLNLNEIELNKDQQRILSNYDAPETWQALYSIEVDDKNRLWISTITESDSTFKWWVLNEEGKALATFVKPGMRTEISVMSKPLYKIWNGYFYELQRDIPNGIDRIVKYKIEFTES